jgi:hypothetical protein
MRLYSTFSKCLSLLYFAFSLLNALGSTAQGTNNNYPIDSVDIKMAFEQLGIQVYKFPYTVSNVQKPRFNFKIEMTDSSKLVYENKGVDDLLAHIPKGLSAEDMGINEAFPKIDSGNHFVRIYIKHSNPDKLALIIAHRYSNQKIEFDFDSEKYGPSNSRAFNYTGIRQKEMVPLVVFYANIKGKPVLSCPGRLGPKEVQKRYDKTIIIYGALY